MKKNFVLRSASIFLLVCLFSCCLFITANASEVIPPSDAYTVSGDVVYTYLSSLYPSTFAEMNMYSNRVALYLNAKSNKNNYAMFYAVYICSSDVIKLSQGDIWIKKNQDVRVELFITTQEQNRTSPVLDSTGWWTHGVSFGTNSWPQWIDGSGDSLGYRKLSLSISSGWAYISVYPYYAYNAIPSVWEIVAPPSTDLMFYTSPVDTEPALNLPFIEIGTKLGGVKWVDDDGNIHTTHGGGGGSFDIITPDGDSDNSIVSWDRGIGGIFKNIIRCAGAKSSNAQPIKYTFKGQDFVILDPSWFNFSGMTVVRVVLLVSLSLSIIVFLKQMIMKLISAQGNGDGE